MKSKSEINYLPEDKQNSTEKKKKREFKIPFLHSLYIFVCSMKVVGDNVVKYRVYYFLVYLNLNNS